MANITVSLPEPMKDWIEAQARSGNYDDGADYIRELIRRDLDRAAWTAELQPLIDAGLASGISDRSMEELREQARAAALAAARDRGL